MIAVAPPGTRTRSGTVELTLGFGISLVPVTALLWHRQLPDNGAIFRELRLSALCTGAIRGGSWYPRWLPDLNGGYGYPVFVFYQPGYFYVSHGLSFVPLPVLRCALTLALIATVGGI